MTTISFVVDNDDVISALRRLGSSLDSVVESVSREFSDIIAHEARSASARLGEPWKVEGMGPTQRKVIAPEWWAHFVAGGTAPHGPRAAARMIFELDGRTVVAKHVQGQPADHFDDRAKLKTESRVDLIMRDVIRRARV